MFGTMADNALYIMDALPEASNLAELSLKALKHVFVAKPGTMNLEQIRFLKKLADESGVVLQLGTGYKFCPVYKTLIESAQTARVVDVKFQMESACNLKFELFCIFDFVTNILNVNIVKIDVKSWKNAENTPDVFHYAVGCDNGSMINITAYKVAEGEPKLEVTFVTPETVIFADIFKSIITKHDRSSNLSDNMILEAYCEKTVNDSYLQNFRHAIEKDGNAIQTIDKHLQNIISSFELLS